MGFDRGQVYKKMNSYNFYTRIREDKSKDGKVYYMGIKPFSIGQEDLIVDINESMFVFNSKNIKKQNLKKLRAFREYFYGKDKFKLNYIKLQLGDKSQKNDEKMNEALKEIQKIVNTNYEEKDNYFIFSNFEVSIDDEYSIFNMIYKKYQGYFKKCKFDYKKASIKDEIKKSEKVNRDIKNHMIDLIKNYEKYTKVEKEKKYQHLFLKKVNKIKVGGKWKKIIPFEEEYYIYDKTDSGRIDCIFYVLDGRHISEVILVELKVDTGVIGGSHGIHRHLIDIQKLSENDNDFYKNLIDRINYRKKQLDNVKEGYKYKEKFKKSFYIILGKTKDEVDLEQAVKDLNNTNSKIYLSMKNEIEEEFNNNKIKTFTIKEIDKPIMDIYNSIKKDNKVDVKLFIDKNPWNQGNDLKPNYIEKTELFE